MGKSENAIGQDSVVGMKLDVNAMEAALKKLDITPGPSPKLSGLVDLLKKKMSELEAEGETTFECTHCEQVSTFPLGACPFCGVGDDDAGEAAPEESGDGPGDPDDADTRQGGESAEQPEETSTEGLAVEVAEQVLVPARKGRKKAKLALVTPPIDKVHEGIVETALDKAVEELKKLSTIASTGGWYLARKLADVDISGLWKTRLTTEGKAVHKNFDAFVKAELGFSREYYQGLLKVVSRYDDDTIKLIGMSKLRIVVQANDTEEEARRLKRFKDGASRRDVSAEIGRAEGTKPKGDKPKPSTAGKITVALVEKKFKVPFFLKQSKKDEEDGGKPAKQIGDTPWARIPLTNDVFLYVTLDRNSKNEIVGTVEFKRVDPTK